jgi:hypothetical protein
VAQAVEHLSCKCEDLSLYPSATKKKKEKEKEKEKGNLIMYLPPKMNKC